MQSPHCESERITKRGFHTNEKHRQRYACHHCHSHFDDLTPTIFEGHRQPLKVWTLCLYFRGLNLAKPVEAPSRDGRRRLKGSRGRGTLEQEKPPVFGMLQRGGEVILRMLPNVQQTIIRPIIEANVAPGSLIYTDEYNIYDRLPEWGFDHKIVNHSIGDYAWDDDGDEFYEVHVNR